MHKHMLGIVFHPIVRQQSCERFGRNLTGRDHQISQPLTIQISVQMDHDAVWQNNLENGAAGVECFGGPCRIDLPIGVPYLNGKKRERRSRRLRRPCRPFFGTCRMPSGTGDSASNFFQW
jgi:hypothetical protein